jgi:D-beta-D-heptose 7-phosphate kinase/D-beta-D-heptose 1-phosphate adenosyltransferase
MVGGIYPRSPRGVKLAGCDDTGYGRRVDLPKVAPDVATLLARLEPLRRGGRTIVFTNGCFDLLHPGHVRYLTAARAMGDALVVGLNDDASIRRAKGPGRPILTLSERAEVLAGLGAVDHLIAFEDDTPLALIAAIRPDVLVKGADWGLDAIVGRDLVEAAGGRVARVDLVPGVSTTQIVDRIRRT